MQVQDHIELTDTERRVLFVLERDEAVNVVMGGGFTWQEVMQLSKLDEKETKIALAKLHYKGLTTIDDWHGHILHAAVEHPAADSNEYEMLPDVRQFFLLMDYRDQHQPSEMQQ